MFSFYIWFLLGSSFRRPPSCTQELKCSALYLFCTLPVSFAAEKEFLQFMGRTLHFYFPSAQLQISSPEPCGNNNSICFKDFLNFDLNNCLAGKVKLNFLLCRIYIYSIGFIVDNVVFIAAGFMCRTHGPPGCYPAGRDSGEWGRLAQAGCLLLLWPGHTWYLFLNLNLYLHICF